MKKALLFLFAIFFGTAMFAQVTVTLQVDMTGQTVDPAGVHIAGDFQSEIGEPSDWLPDSTALTDMGGGIWEVTLVVPGGIYQYKFLNGNTWGTDENMGNTPCAPLGGNSNRVGDWTANTTTTVCWQSCAPCGMSAVLLQVDLSTQTVSDSGIHVAGDIQAPAGFPSDWDPSTTQLFDTSGNGIYQRLLIVPAGTYQFKFVNGNAWGDDESLAGTPCEVSGNREIVLAANDNLVTTQWCFAACTSCILPVNVTFRVDMTNEVVSGNGVHLAGSFQGWNPGATELFDGNADQIYEATIPVTGGTAIEYKFVNGNAWGGDESVPSECNVNNNRGLTATVDTTVTFCFNQCSESCEVDPPAANVTFYVDLNGATPEATGVWLMGGFSTPTWQAGRMQMTQNTTYPDVYEYTALIDGPANFQYKFSNGEPTTGSVFENGESGNFAAGGCGSSNGIGGFNRTFTRSGTAESPGTFCYDTCINCNNVPLYSGDLIAKNAVLSLAPNPMSRYAVMQVPAAFATRYDVRMFDMTGRLVRTELGVTNSSHLIGKANLVEGMYLIHVTNEKNETAVQRLIVN